jgi:hypothetical protein
LLLLSTLLEPNVETNADTKQKDKNMNNIKALQDALKSITLADILALGSDSPPHLFFLLNSCSFALSEDTQKQAETKEDPSILKGTLTADDAQAFLNWYEAPLDFFTNEEIECMKQGRKLAAIRWIKERLDCPLRNAKVLIEEGMRRWFPSTWREVQPTMFNPFNAEQTVQDIENSREFYESFFTYTERSSMAEGFLNSAIALVRKRLDITQHEATLVVNAGMRMWSRKA